MGVIRAGVQPVPRPGRDCGWICSVSGGGCPFPERQWAVREDRTGVAMCASAALGYLELPAPQQTDTASGIRAMTAYTASRGSPRQPRAGGAVQKLARDPHALGALPRGSTTQTHRSVAHRRRAPAGRRPASTDELAASAEDAGAARGADRQPCPCLERPGSEPAAPCGRPW